MSISSDVGPASELFIIFKRKLEKKIILGRFIVVSPLEDVHWLSKQFYVTMELLSNVTVNS